MSERYDVLCYGAISLDISGRTEGLVQGGQTDAIDYVLSPGGDATLVALTLAGLGWKVALAGGPIGHDPMGNYLREVIIGSGVDLYAATQGKTSVSAVIVGSGGDRTSITFHEATPLEQIPVPEELLPGTGYLYVDGCYGQNAALLGEQARAAGIPALVNANAGNRELFRSFDVAIAAAPNVRALSSSPREAAALMRASGAKVAIVTMGEQGCVCCAAETSVLPAFKVAPVDCTGAGAAFTAGFIHAGLRGMGLPDQLRSARAAGALKCLHRGSFRPMSGEELDSFGVSR